MARIYYSMFVCTFIKLSISLSRIASVCPNNTYIETKTVSALTREQPEYLDVDDDDGRNDKRRGKKKE